MPRWILEQLLSHTTRALTDGRDKGAHQGRGPYEAERGRAHAQMAGDEHRAGGVEGTQRASRGHEDDMEHGPEDDLDYSRERDFDHLQSDMVRNQFEVTFRVSALFLATLFGMTLANIGIYVIKIYF